MGKTRIPEKVKLISGVIYSGAHPGDARSAETSLEKLFGAIDLRSAPFGFDSTDYYADELGQGLERYWISFEHLLPPDGLHRAKLFSNKLELAQSDGGKRRINLDPGYLTAANLVLFTTKNFSHRIFIADGIYAEVTLIYRGGGFCDLEWTYPDYRLDASKEFFSEARKKYLQQLHPDQ